LDHGKSLIGYYRGPGCNESDELLAGVFSPPKLINMVPSGLVVTDTTPYLHLFADILKLMASESFITIGPPVRAAIASRREAERELPGRPVPGSTQRSDRRESGSSPVYR
jgi:hypothetical protein